MCYKLVGLDPAAWFGTNKSEVEKVFKAPVIRTNSASGQQRGMHVSLSFP